MKNRNDTIMASSARAVVARMRSQLLARKRDVSITFAFVSHWSQGNKGDSCGIQQAGDIRKKIFFNGRLARDLR